MPSSAVCAARSHLSLHRLTNAKDALKELYHGPERKFCILIVTDTTVVPRQPSVSQKRRAGQKSMHQHEVDGTHSVMLV